MQKYFQSLMLLNKLINHILLKKLKKSLLVESYKSFLLLYCLVMPMLLRYLFFEPSITVTVSYFFTSKTSSYNNTTKEAAWQNLLSGPALSTNLKFC